MSISLLRLPFAKVTFHGCCQARRFGTDSAGVDHLTGVNSESQGDAAMETGPILCASDKNGYVDLSGRISAWVKGASYARSAGI